MTETTTAPVGATRNLYRDPDDDMFAGVCAALARYTDTDPIIWRIATVVLAVFGAGVALYVLGWVLIPKRGEEQSLAESWLRRREGGLPLRTVALIAIVLIIIAFGLDDGRGLGVAAVLGAVGYLVSRDRQGRPLAPSYQPQETDPAADGAPPAA